MQNKLDIPFFLTIDTEGDNIWSRPKNITSKNTENLYRFQILCEKYNVKPIYLTNYEAAINSGFQQFIEIHKNNLEVGLHLHAWNSPPDYNLTNDDFYHQPYLHEYPDKIIIEKIDYMTKLLQDTFNSNIISHRGGRYSINDTIIESLYKNGIKVDCSVVPGINWAKSKGNPSENGGPNFKYSKANIHQLNDLLLEIPVSTNISKFNSILDEKYLPLKILAKLLNQQTVMLRSKVNNLPTLKKIVEKNIQNNVGHLEYILHSSELVNGYSPLIKSTKDENIFYKNLELFFIYLQNLTIKSYTFKEYLDSKNV
jgi:hypothetical protein